MTKIKPELIYLGERKEKKLQRNFMEHVIFHYIFFYYIKLTIFILLVWGNKENNIAKWSNEICLSLFLHMAFIGYYQPAGPLINSHLVGGPQNLTKQPTASPLDPESLQQSQQTSSVGEGKLRV